MDHISFYFLTYSALSRYIEIKCRQLHKMQIFDLNKSLFKVI